MASARILRKFLHNLDVVQRGKMHTLAKNSNHISQYSHLNHKGHFSKRYCIVGLEHNNVHKQNNHGNCFMQIRNKGHSHFQNIQHMKAARDGERMKMSSRLTSDMAIAVKEGGSTDPKLNKQLANVIARMEANNIPKAKIKTSLEKLKETAKNIGTEYVEVRGPKGIVFVVEIFTANLKTSKDGIRSLMKKLPYAKVSDQLSWMRVFEQIGVVTVPVTKDMDVSNMDQYVEIAIETGSQDVILTEGAGEDMQTQSVLKFHCDPLTVKKVAKDITEMYDLNVSSAEVDLVPHHWEILESEEDIEMCETILERLHKQEDVLRVFDNISVPEE